MDAIILDLGGDIKGDCLLEGYQDKIELMSYSHNVAMQVTNDVSNSERTSGKPHIGEFTVTKFVDSSTPSLNEYCCAGKPLPEVKILVGRNAAEGDGKHHHQQRGGAERAGAGEDDVGEGQPAGHQQCGQHLARRSRLS